MSVRHEVISLSQLLRRSDNSKSRRGTSRMPPLPLQTSVRRTATLSAAEQKRMSTPFIERPSAQKNSRYQPLSFARQPRNESHQSNSQPEVQTCSQSSSVYVPLSQEVYDGEGEDLSVVTSLSQSSFSQTPSQNLLASSQDDQSYRLQQWQAEHEESTGRPASSSYTEAQQQTKKLSSLVSSEQAQRQQQEQRDKERQLQEQREKEQQLQELRERELMKQREQRENELLENHQQRLQELMARFTSPIKKSVEDINASLTSSTNGQEQQKTMLLELSEGVKDVAVSVTELRQQNLKVKSICDEYCKTATQETSTVKAALTELRGKIGTIEGSVKACSDLISRFLEGEGTNREALLAAVTATSCRCTQEKAPVEDPPNSSKKRKRSPRDRDTPERTSCQYTPTCSRFIESRSPLHYDIDGRTYRRGTGNRADRWGLRHALKRIEALRAKRCSQFTGF